MASITRSGWRRGLGAQVQRRAPRVNLDRLLSSPPLFQLGDSFVTNDCSQHCTCASQGILLCEPYGCRAGESCIVANFTRGCFQGEPESFCSLNQGYPPSLPLLCWVGFLLGLAKFAPSPSLIKYLLPAMQRLPQNPLQSSPSGKYDTPLYEQ